MLFGTDGIRGKAVEYPMTPELALKLGKAVAYLFRQENRRNRIIIGKDTRLSGYIFEHALVSGICSMGLDAILASVMTTSGVSYLTVSMRADAGIMISASHNPYYDNGIKIFNYKGYKLSKQAEQGIENFILNKSKNQYNYPQASRLGKAIKLDNARGMYIGFLKSHFPRKYDLNGLKIAVDCANGSSYKIAPDVFSDLGADVKSFAINPNGVNINHNCGALHPDFLREKMLKDKFDIGIVFDGDADRILIINKDGTILDGNHILYIFAKHLKGKNALKNDSIVSTVMANTGFIHALKDLGVETFTSKVGDRNVFKKMIETKSIIGGESSGHIILSDYHTTGDGILVALKLLAIMIESEFDLNKLLEGFNTFPSKLTNIPIKERLDLSKSKELKKVITDIENILGEKGRVLVRYSQTQLLCRVLVEAPEISLAEKYCQEISDTIKEYHQIR